MIQHISLFLAIFANPAAAIEQSYPLVWSPDKTAVAFCANDAASACYIICNDKVTNVSEVEKANLGKIGHYQYDKVVTYPISWESNGNLGCMFWFQTHAWIDGQRHTVKEPATVSSGEYRGR
ncbi:hypothetical protein DXV75_02670 [Alteromonas aestuariivivens]|uniref:Uncharacterized protein n=1 Tax=Alteromonas aestuariivivens TaxID=1938339 RepID=A0A3D8MER7_9ALTE|nr:hypothetical protein [Alteromonas aestuariivivens]RDV29369.1 hypothetical protein DXV75_02670 [Alteromonas aestuariivivens]